MGIPRPDPGDLTPPDTAHIQSQILQLDADAALLRNRSQITPATRARIDAMGRESAGLRALLPDKSISEACTEADTKHEKQAEQFAIALALYQKHQAPALKTAQSALRHLTSCSLPPALERNILQLNTAIDHYHAEISNYTPSQGLSAATLRIAARYGV